MDLFLKINILFLPPVEISDTTQNDFQSGSTIIIIDTGGIQGGIDESVARSRLKFFSLRWCSNEKMTHHLAKYNVTTLSVFVSDQDINVYNFEEIQLLLKCMINLLTLMEQQQQRRRRQQQHTNLHVSGSLIRNIYRRTNEVLSSTDVDELYHIVPDYNNYLVNMITTFQMYFITYNNLHDITFEQCYMNKDVS